MKRVFSVALRPGRSTRRLRALAVVTAAVTFLLAGPTAARAAQVESGSIEVNGLAFAIDFLCAGGCPDPAPATTSSGSISGLGTLGPFTVSWASPPLGSNNLVPTISYTPLCVEGSVSAGALIGGSQLAISGALLTYAGSVNAPATVTVAFSGRLADGAFVPLTNQIIITGGGNTINIAGLGIPGSMVAVPLSPPPVNCNGSQTFTASGNFLTFGQTTP